MVFSNIIRLTKKSISSSLFLILIMHLIWCSSDVNTTILPEYVNSSLITNPSLAIYPFIENVKIENRSSLNKHLGAGDCKRLFVSYFLRKLPIAIRQYSAFENIEISAPTEEVALREVPLKNRNNMSIYLKRPERDASIEYNSMKIDFVLFLNNIKKYETVVNTFSQYTNTSISHIVLNSIFNF